MPYWIQVSKFPSSHNVGRHHGFAVGVSVSFDLMYREYLTNKSKSAMNKLYSADRKVKDHWHDQHDTNEIESIAWYVLVDIINVISFVVFRLL